MAIEYRMSGDEFTEGGVGIGDAVLFAKAIRENRSHTYFGGNITARRRSYAMQPAYLPMATNVRFAERMKKSWRYRSLRWGHIIST